MTALTWPQHRIALRPSRHIALAAICALPAALNLLLLAEPFDHDEGVYATVAQALLDGYVPYRDVFDHKPPLIYGWYATSFVLFGENEWAPRLLGCLALSATAWLIHGCASALYSVRAGVAASLVFALTSGVAATESAANVEPFLLLPLAGMLRLFIYACRHRISARWMFPVGLLAGAALLTKEVAVWHVAVISFATLVAGERRVARIGWLTLGTVLPVVAIFGLFCALGAAGEFIYANIEYNFIYGSTVEPAARISLALQAFPVMFLLAAPAALVSAVGAAIAIRRFNPADRLVLAWAGASVLAIVSTGRVFPHYFVILLPAYGLLAGAFFASPVRWMDIGRWRRVASVGALGTAVLVCLLLNLPAFVSASAFERQEAKGAGEGWQHAFSNEEVGSYIKAHSLPRDRVWQAGREAGMYFHADRRPATPIFYDRPFWLDRSALDRTLADLESTPPLYLVDALEGAHEYQPQHPVVLAIRAFIAERYVYEAEIAYATIYRLKY